MCKGNLPRYKPLKNEESHKTNSSNINLYSRRIPYSDDAQPQSGGMQYLGDSNSMVSLWVHNYAEMFSCACHCMVCSHDLIPIHTHIVCTVIYTDLLLYYV